MRKKELIERCREIRDNNMWKKLSEEDTRWLIDNVFSYHPQWSWWEDQGVVAIRSEINPSKYATAGFWIYFKDGSKADISWNKAIQNIKK